MENWVFLGQDKTRANEFLQVVRRRLHILRKRKHLRYTIFLFQHVLGWTILWRAASRVDDQMFPKKAPRTCMIEIHCKKREVSLCCLFPNCTRNPWWTSDGPSQPRWLIFWRFTWPEIFRVAKQMQTWTHAASTAGVLSIRNAVNNSF